MEVTLTLREDGAFVDARAEGGADALTDDLVDEPPGRRLMNFLGSITGCCKEREIVIERGAI